MDLPTLWTQIRADLERARNALPGNATDDADVSEYEEFLGHNELELACDSLESYGENHALTKEFWIALRDAAAKMQLPDRARRYEEFANLC